MANYVLDGVMGACVGDALGVPVEFSDREVLQKKPVIGMLSGGVHSQSAGTWSDDTSMTLCAVDSLINGLDYADMMDRFRRWMYEGEYTPGGDVFDFGAATKRAIDRFVGGAPPLECGGNGEMDNGNGSLMRILPILFYMVSEYGSDPTEWGSAFEVIHNVSALTHAHPRSLIACGIYISVASMLMQGFDIDMSVDLGVYEAVAHYRRSPGFSSQLKSFARLEDKNFKSIGQGEIASGGYVVDTLEAALWCLLNTGSFSECVLKAVNLGGDSDTTASVAGGLAGLHYGYDSIPRGWIGTIARRKYIEGLCEGLYISLNRSGIKKLCQYMPYFESSAADSACRWVKGGAAGESNKSCHPEYDEKFKDFIQAVYRSNLMSRDYLSLIRSAGLRSADQMAGAIDTADIELLKAILTGYVRQERFNEGLWASAVENKIFLRILTRLRELLERRIRVSPVSRT